ncbi:MAG: SBBP repeat-containing protein, partial [Polyangiaceae bacterium]|nr:SBBP repeat-containing protein [Polyangiaceae bacterium]
NEQFGTASDDVAYSLDIDNYGNVYLSGYTQGNLEQPVGGSDDAFVAKVDPFGNLLWINQFGTNKYDAARELKLSADGTRAYVVGQTKGNIDGDSSNDSKGDYFVAFFDSTGDLLGATQNGVKGQVQYSNSFALGDNGEVYVTGATWGTLVSGQAVGYYDLFIHEFSE